MSEPNLAANLLATARDRLRDEVAPAMHGGLRFPAAMIANAMAIASRKLEHGRLDHDEDGRLRTLLHGRTRRRLKVSAPGPLGRGRTG